MIIVGNVNTQLSVVVRICYFLRSTLWGGQSRGCDPYFTVQETEIYIDWVTCPESQHSWVMGLKQDREMIPWGWRSLNPWTWDCALDTQTKSSPHSLPTSSCLRMLQGDSWYPEVPGPREWLKSQPNSWLNPWAQIHCLSRKLRPPDGLGDENMHLAPSPPPQHMILSTAALQWDFLVVRWPPWMTSSLLDSNWLRTQDILNQLPTWQLHREFASSSTVQTWMRSSGYSLAGNRISWAGGVLGAYWMKSVGPSASLTKTWPMVGAAWTKAWLGAGSGWTGSEWAPSLPSPRSPRSRLCCINHSLSSWIYSLVLFPQHLQWSG